MSFFSSQLCNEIFDINRNNDERTNEDDWKSLEKNVRDKVSATWHNLNDINDNCIWTKDRLSRRMWMWIQYAIKWRIIILCARILSLFTHTSSYLFIEKHCEIVKFSISFIPPRIHSGEFNFIKIIYTNYFAKSKSNSKLLRLSRLILRPVIVLSSIQSKLIFIACWKNFKMKSLKWFFYFSAIASMNHVTFCADIATNWTYINEICGVSYSDRIIGGVNAQLGEYPWIALIGIRRK